MGIENFGCPVIVMRGLTGLGMEYCTCDMGHLHASFEVSRAFGSLGSGRHWTDGRTDRRRRSIPYEIS